MAALGMGFAMPGFANFVFPGTVTDLTADTSLSQIIGSLDLADNPNDVNVFELSIADPLDFSAYTVGGAFRAADPELFLFNSAGYGVYSNDDASVTNTQACLPSLFSNPCDTGRGGVGPLTAGIYYLAITLSLNSPLSAGGYIFSPVSSTDVVGPDLTQGGGSPITGWDNGAFTSPDYDLNQYDIVIHGIGVVPEPSALFALGLAGGLLILMRRRRAA